MNKRRYYILIMSVVFTLLFTTIALGYVINVPTKTAPSGYHAINKYVVVDTNNSLVLINADAEMTYIYGGYQPNGTYCEIWQAVDDNNDGTNDRWIAQGIQTGFFMISTKTIIDANYAFKDFIPYPSIDDINNNKFTGLKILQPYKGSTVHWDSANVTVKVRIASPNINWVSGTNASRIWDWVMNEFISSSVLKIDGIEMNIPPVIYNMKVEQTGNNILPYKNSTYSFEATFPVTNLVKGTNMNITVGGNCLTNIDIPRASTWLSDSISFSNTVVDLNNDGIEDNTGLPTNNVDTSDKTQPKRPQYTTGFVGDIQYGFDSLVYYISYPFVMIGNILNQIINWFAQSTSWIANVTTFFGAIFSFLPRIVVEYLVAIFSVTVLFLVIKIARG